MKINQKCDICGRRVKKDQRKAGINLCKKHFNAQQEKENGVRK